MYIVKHISKWSNWEKELFWASLSEKKTGGFVKFELFLAVFLYES